MLFGGGPDFFQPLLVGRVNVAERGGPEPRDDFDTWAAVPHRGTVVPHGPHARRGAAIGPDVAEATQRRGGRVVGRLVRAVLVAGRHQSR